MHMPPGDPASTLKKKVIRIDLKDFEFISRATIELSHAMGTMALIRPCLAIFGSNQITTTSPHKHYFDLAVEIAEIMGKEGWNCLTGGGTGITEAATLGAGLGGAKTIAVRLVP